jgi:hypothetical protein
MPAKTFMAVGIHCALLLTVFTHNSVVSHNAMSPAQYYINIRFINCTVAIRETSDRQLAQIYDLFTAHSPNISKQNLFVRLLIHHNVYDRPCPCPLYFSVFTQTTFLLREIISRKLFMEAFSQFGSCTVGNGALINGKQKMTNLLKVGKSHGVELYQANVTFQSIMLRRTSYIYIYMRPEVCPIGSRSIWEQFEGIWSGFY